MSPFNFTIHYRPGVKMGHADFASWMDTFLPKDSTSASTSTLRAQKQPELSSLKRRITPTIKLFNLIDNKKQKSNPMASPRKVEYIRRKKTHNRHYCQQCRIYYQGYNHRCPTPTDQNCSNFSDTSSEGEGWINPNPMIVKPKSKSSLPKEFDSWPKLNPKGKWNADLTWGEPDDSEWY